MDDEGKVFTIKDGTYKFGKGKPQEYRGIGLEHERNLEFIVAITFIIGILMEIILMYRIKLVELGSPSLLIESLSIFMNIIFIVFSILSCMALIFGIKREITYPLKRRYSFLGMIIFSLIFFNFATLFLGIKELIYAEITILDYFIYFITISVSILFVGGGLIVLIYRKYKNVETNQTALILKATDLSLVAVIIGIVVLIVNTSALIFSGNISFSGQLNPFASGGIVNFIVIVVSGIAIALFLFVIEDTSIFRTDQPDNVWNKAKRGLDRWKRKMRY